MSKPTAPLPKLWDDLALRPYLGEIARRHGIVETLALPSMRDLPPLRIESLFVPPALATEWVSPDSDPAKWREGKSLFAALQESPQLVVLGDPGGGKTTLSNWLAWRLAVGLATPLPEILAERVPLPCILRLMPASVFDGKTSLPALAEFLAKRMLGDKADDALLAGLRARVEAGQYVLILDGVDEIAVSQRGAVAGWVGEAHSQHAVVLVTSRMVGYEDYPVDRNFIKDQEFKASFPSILRSELERFESEYVKTHGPLARSAASVYAHTKARASIGALVDSNKFATRLYLMPFDQRRIVAFVENWYRQRCGAEQEALEKTADLLTALAKSETTQRLARTPNLLSLMSIVFRERAHLPDGKALLYDEIANAYINTIDTQRRISAGDALAPYTWKERRAWIAFVGFQMQLRRKVESPQQSLFDEEPYPSTAMLASEDEVKFWLAQAMQQAGVAQPEVTAGEFLYWVARRSGLLLPRGEGRYAFVHLSFQEYFCACYLYDRVSSPAYLRNTLPADAPVTPEKIAFWGGLSTWRETLVYLLELLSAERGGEWVDDLAQTLFGEIEGDFIGNSRALATRALSNRHIRLSEMWCERLADACVRWGDEQALVEAGYAAVFEENVSVEILCSEAAKKWRRLRINDAQFSNASVLAGLEKLKCLNLDGTAITDLYPLGRLPRLEWLSLKNTPLTDLTSVSRLENLQFLVLDGSPVVDLHPLARLKKLNQLYLRNTPVTDPSPLAGMKSLTALGLGGEEDIDLTPLAPLASRLWVANETGYEELSVLLERQAEERPARNNPVNLLVSAWNRLKR